MAGDWIKMRIDLATDPAVVLIASRTGLSEDETVGKLHRLWGWVSRQTRDGSATVTPTWIDKYVAHDGFASAMCAAKWLKIGEGIVTFPKFDRHNSLSAKVRAENTRRQKVSRNSRDKSATREEKRREEIVVAKATTPKVSKPKVSIDDITLPDGMDTPAVRAAVEQWIIHKRTRGKGYKSANGVDVLARKWLMAGPAAFVDAIENSIANNYDGVFSGGPRNGTGTAKPSGNSDATRVKNERTDGDFANIPVVQGVERKPA